MKLTEKLQSFFKSKSGGWALLAAGLLGILLIALPGKTEQTAEKVVSVQTTSGDAYAAQLEEKLTEIISGIAGAGACRVMVTVETGVEYVYAQECKTSRQADGNLTEISEESTSEYLVIDGGALLITEKQPEVRGVAVVCRGAGQAVVRQRVLDAVTTVLQIPSTRVSVTEKA